MSQPTDESTPQMIEPTGTIEPVDPSHSMIDPSKVPPELLAALGRAPAAAPVFPPAPVAGPAPVWTEATQNAVRYIGEYLIKRCPLWVWAPWPFTPDSGQIAQALIDAGYKKIDDLGNDVADDPNGEHVAHLQTINWDAHFRGNLKDASKFRVVSDGRPENGGIGPIISIGAPDGEAHAEDIAMMLESWQARYASEEQPETAPPSQPNANGNTPVSGVLAWACGLCARVVRTAADGSWPSFVCPGCGQTKNWRQPTIDELANVSPEERAALSSAPTSSVPGFVPPGMATRQGDNEFYAGMSPPGQLQGGQYAQQPNFAPDPETRAIADICWLLESIAPDARTRVVRYIRDRWS